MDALRQYILSVSVAAILCGLVSSLMPKGNFQSILKLICGVFLALLVVKPVSELDPKSILTRITGQVTQEGEAAVAFGEEMARDSMTQYIKREAEAYILDKANAHGITAEVEVSVGAGELPIPVAAVIRGTVPEPLKLELERLIGENLGIAKENLQWIG